MIKNIKQLREIRNLISHEKLKTAIERLKSYMMFNRSSISNKIDFQDLYRAVIIAESQHIDLNNKIRLGIIEDEFALTQRNNIYKYVISIVNKIEEDYLNQNLTNSENKEHITKEDLDKNILEESSKSITLTIDKNIDEFSSEEQDRLIKAIKGLLKLKSEIRIKKIDKGSVIITLEIESSEQAENLFLAVKTGALSKLGVTDAKLISYISNHISEIKLNNSVGIKEGNRINKIKVTVKEILPKSIEKAIECLKQELKHDSQSYDDLIGLHGRFNRNKNYQQKSLITYQEAETEFIKIEGAIIYLVNTLQEDELN